jgi:PKHD-type hydroxylase
MNTTYDWWLNMSELEYYAWFDNVFSDTELDMIASMFDEDELKIGTTSDDNKQSLDIRDSKIRFLESSLEENKWIFQRLTATVQQANNQFFQFELDRIESLQYTTYKKNQYYRDHLDIMYKSPSNAVRKLSFSVQLSDPDDYKGGDLLLKISSDPTQVKKTRGTVIFFPSYVLHEVTPIEQGVRKSLVGWVTGPRWK